jgi:aryl-alcohol dehydrogenase-like predicted oxidoreductase
MTDLPKRELGRTGLQVTMLGYGAMELGRNGSAGGRRGSTTCSRA